MRQKALRKKDPERGAKIRTIRSAREQKVDGVDKVITDKKGNEVVLNLMKRFLFQEPYTNTEYQKELNRYAQSQISNKQVKKANEG